MSRLKHWERLDSLSQRDDVALQLPISITAGLSCGLFFFLYSCDASDVNLSSCGESWREQLHAAQGQVDVCSLWATIPISALC